MIRGTNTVDRWLFYVGVRRIASVNSDYWIGHFFDSPRISAVVAFRRFMNAQLPGTALSAGELINFTQEPTPRVRVLSPQTKTEGIAFLDHHPPPTKRPRPNLLLHCGAQAVDRHVVEHVPTPRATETWTPIPHLILPPSSFPFRSP